DGSGSAPEPRRDGRRAERQAGGRVRGPLATAQWRADGPVRPRNSRARAEARLPSPRPSRPVLPPRAWQAPGRPSPRGPETDLEAIPHAFSARPVARVPGRRVRLPAQKKPAPPASRAAPPPNTRPDAGTLPLVPGRPPARGGRQGR